MSPQTSSGELSAAVAELLDRDDCVLKGWAGAVVPNTSHESKALSRLVMGNKDVASYSDTHVGSELLKVGYYRFDTLLALGVYNEPDEEKRAEIRGSLLKALNPGGNMYMTVKMTFRDGDHPRTRYFTDGELKAELAGRFESVAVIPLHNKWTQLVICTGRKTDE